MREDAAASLSDMIPNESGDLVLLLDRIEQCRVLREHHVWEAVGGLWPDGWEEAFGQSRRAFGALLQTDALVDAILLLVADASPRRSVEAMTNENGRWTCRMRADFRRGLQIFSATHADLAAATLETLLLTIPEQELPAHEAELFCYGSFLTAQSN
jgi:hypothetical protein